jgi:uncharacterized membrane protein
MILGALMSIGFVAERALQRTDPRVRVPVVVRTLLTGLALGGPWIAADTGLVPAVAQIDRTLVTLAVALLSYVFVTWLVGVADDGRCGRPSSN